mmetsp:Transcript_14813/g.32160  ORF Transcript_14813/g.32160 Transcript_14813/m.32160 type:complete len:310 (+) Transcript_14813:266-1195(+)
MPSLDLSWTIRSNSGHVWCSIQGSGMRAAHRGRKPRMRLGPPLGFSSQGFPCRKSPVLHRMRGTQGMCSHAIGNAAGGARWWAHVSPPQGGQAPGYSPISNSSSETTRSAYHARRTSGHACPGIPWYAGKPCWGVWRQAPKSRVLILPPAAAVPAVVPSGRAPIIFHPGGLMLHIRPCVLGQVHAACSRQARRCLRVPGCLLPACQRLCLLNEGGGQGDAPSAAHHADTVVNVFLVGGTTSRPCSPPCCCTRGRTLHRRCCCGSHHHHRQVSFSQCSGRRLLSSCSQEGQGYIQLLGSFLTGELPGSCC